MLVLMVIIGGLFSATSLAVNYSVPEATTSGVMATGMDTVAGSPTILTSSQTFPNSQIIFEVSKPDGSAVSIVGRTDATGVSKVMFSGENTKKAGTYDVMAKLTDSINNYEYTSFIVSPGPVSSVNSKVEPADQVVESVHDKAFITITLLDNYNNPVQGHSVRLISSALDDFQNGSSNVTDIDGQTVFTAMSSQSGVVTYVVYDLTDDKILNNKARVAYLDGDQFILTNNIPSNYSYGASGNPSGLVDHLSFEDVPMIINPGGNISFKVTAYDNIDQAVINYDGTVHLSVESGNANYVTLPADYSFTPQDLGSHTFGVALGFQQAGTYQLRVQDTMAEAIYGQFIFVVGNGAQQDIGAVTITSPVSGISSNSVQVVTGVSTPGAKLKIFDNDIELTSIVADIGGAFSYTTPVLADGSHKFSVAVVNDVGTILSVSSIIDVSIDTAGVQISNVVIEPSETIDAGSQFTVKIYTNSPLSKASLLIADNIYELVADPQGYYVVQAPAPAEFGEYSLSFILKDELGNESKIDTQSKITVQGQVTVPEFVPDVTNVVAETDDSRVILNWDPVTESTNPIQHYRVYVGSSPTDLTTAIDTFTDATTWYVPNLENGEDYSFAVVAVDTKGNISAHFSNIVIATPNPIVIEVPDPEIELGLGGDEEIKEMPEDASKTGPEVLWLILVSSVGGICYSETARRRKL